MGAANKAGNAAPGPADRARFPFETGHATRCSIRHRDVHSALPAPSESRTACYHPLKLGEHFVEDAVRFHTGPRDQLRRIGGHLCFCPGKVDAILVDGKVVS